MQSQQINAENNSSHRNVIAMQSWHKQIKPTEHDVLWKCMKNNWQAEKTLASSVLSERLEKRDFGWFYLASKWCLFWPALCSFTNFDELASERWWYFLNFDNFSQANGQTNTSKLKSFHWRSSVAYSTVQYRYNNSHFRLWSRLRSNTPCMYIVYACIYSIHITCNWLKTRSKHSFSWLKMKMQPHTKPQPTKREAYFNSFKHFYVQLFCQTLCQLKL